jgi:cell division protein FtsB
MRLTPDIEAQVQSVHQFAESLHRTLAELRLAQDCNSELQCRVARGAADLATCVASNDSLRARIAHLEERVLHSALAELRLAQDCNSELRCRIARGVADLATCVASNDSLRARIARLEEHVRDLGGVP